MASPSAISPANDLWAASAPTRTDGTGVPSKYVTLNGVTARKAFATSLKNRVIDSSSGSHTADT